MKLKAILSNSGNRTTVLHQRSCKQVSNGVMRNSRRARIVDPESRIWWRTSAPFALLPLIFALLLATGCASEALAADITAIPTPSYASTYASGINDLGYLVGGVVAPHSNSCPWPEAVCTFLVGTAFTYSHGHLTYEGNGCDTYDCFGNVFTGINNSAQIVGTASGQEQSYHGYVTWTSASLFSGGRWTNIPSIEPRGIGVGFNQASAINASGMVVGRSDYIGNLFAPQHAFLYSGGQTTDLGDLTGSSDNYKQSSANAINDRGQVVGVSDTKSGAQHAFLYSNGKMSDLGSLGGNSNALGINNAGEIVGTTSNSEFLVNPDFNAPQSRRSANTVPRPGTSTAT